MRSSFITKPYLNNITMFNVTLLEYKNIEMMHFFTIKLTATWFRVATLPGNLEFDNLGKKKPGIWEFFLNLEKPRILNKNH